MATGKCCCCFKMKNGIIAIGLITLIYKLVKITFLSIELQVTNMTTGVEEEVYGMEFYHHTISILYFKFCAKVDPTFFYVGYGLVICATCISAMFSIMLMVGAAKGKKLLLTPWIAMTSLEVLLNFYSLIKRLADLCSGVEIPYPYLSVGGTLVGMAILLYFLSCVSELFNSLPYDNKPQVSFITNNLKSQFKEDPFKEEKDTTPLV